jgi:hypothetical protein
LTQQRREVAPQVGVGEAPEIALAPEAVPLLGEDGKRKGLALGEQGRPSGLL